MTFQKENNTITINGLNVTSEYIFSDNSKLTVPTETAPNQTYINFYIEYLMQEGYAVTE